VVVKIIYDHRVLDGRRVAQCLNDLDRVLNVDLLAELRTPIGSNTEPRVSEFDLPAAHTAARQDDAASPPVADCAA
jgi:hypothetical protein